MGDKQGEWIPNASYIFHQETKTKVLLYEALKQQAHFVCETHACYLTDVLIILLWGGMPPKGILYIS